MFILTPLSCIGVTYHIANYKMKNLAKKSLGQIQKQKH